MSGVQAPDWYAGQQDILSHLKADPTLAQADILEGSVGDLYEIPMVGTTVKPHALVEFMALSVSKEGQHIVGGAYDSGQGQLIVNSIAGDPDTARQLSQRVLNSLLGYAPTGCSELTLALFAGIGKVSSSRTPTRYSADQAFRTLVNSTLL